MANLTPTATGLVSEADLRASIARDIAAERETMMARAQTPGERAWASTFYRHCERVVTTGEPWLG